MLTVVLSETHIKHIHSWCFYTHIDIYIYLYIYVYIYIIVSTHVVAAAIRLVDRGLSVAQGNQDLKLIEKGLKDAPQLLEKDISEKDFHRHAPPPHPSTSMRTKSLCKIVFVTLYVFCTHENE
jgi:hypothetical protein